MKPPVPLTRDMLTRISAEAEALRQSDIGYVEICYRDPGHGAAVHRGIANDEFIATVEAARITPPQCEWRVLGIEKYHIPTSPTGRTLTHYWMPACAVIMIPLDIAQRFTFCPMCGGEIVRIDEPDSTDTDHGDDPHVPHA